MLRNGLIALLILMFTAPLFAQELQVVAGAGPSTRVAALFFKEFSQKPAAKGYDFTVPLRSTKHQGGVENTDSYMFGRTGRPLNPGELALNKEEIFLAMVPITFVAGRGVMIQSLSVRELEMIYRKELTNWKILGGADAPITTVGREKTEALFSELKNSYYFFRQAKFDETFKHDHEVTEFLRTEDGKYALAFGAAPNFYQMNQLFVTGGLRAGVRVGLVYDKKNAEHPLVKAVQAFAQSEEWRGLVKKSPYELLPINLDKIDPL